MYIKSENVLLEIAEKIKHIQNCIDEINNLMPDDISYKDLRILSKEIILTAREIRDL
jgi:hypothetical protein